MKALEISLIILKVMGFDNSFKNYPLKLIYSVQYTIQTIFLLFVILPSFAYTYSHLQNVTQATDAAYVLFCYAYTLCTLWSFVMVKEKVINTVSDLGELVERSIFVNSIQFIVITMYISHFLYDFVRDAAKETIKQNIHRCNSER